jgi:hypothetical protein
MIETIAFRCEDMDFIGINYYLFFIIAKKNKTTIANTMGAIKMSVYAVNFGLKNFSILSYNKKTANSPKAVIAYFIF